MMLAAAAAATGVGCHFLLQCMKVKSQSQSEAAQSIFLEVYKF